MSKCILITGGAGYIGSHTAVELLNAGFEAVIVDNFCNSSEDIPARIEKITSKKIVCYNADIRDRAALNKIFDKHNFFSVIHFAGLKAVGESCQKPLLYYNNNVGGTIALLETMQTHGVKKMIFSSSATVYGVPERLPIDENCRLSTTNPYGATKLAIENILHDLFASDNEWSVNLLRYFNPVGAHESGLIGEDPKGIPNNLTPYIADVATGKQPFLRVFGDDYGTRDGTGVRDYIHVVDLAKGHLKALNNKSDSGVHTFNLGTGRGFTVLEVVKAFEKACGFPIPYKVVGRRDGDVAECFADPSKANKELGWKTQLSLEDMMQSLWKWVKR